MMATTIAGREGKAQVQTRKREPFFLAEFWAAAGWPSREEKEKARKQTAATLRAYKGALVAMREWHEAVREMFRAAKKTVPASQPATIIAPRRTAEAA